MGVAAPRGGLGATLGDRRLPDLPELGFVAGNGQHPPLALVIVLDAPTARWRQS
jgi:hypothetical protein